MLIRHCGTPGTASDGQIKKQGQSPLCGGLALLRRRSKKNDGRQHIVWCAGRGAVQTVRPCRVGHLMRGGKAMHLFPGHPHSLPSCRTLPFSRIMPGDGESRTACTTRGLAGDPVKSFWQGWGSLRGKGRPFFKKGPPSPSSFYSCSSASISASSWRMPSRRAAAVSLRPAWSSLPTMPSRVSASQGKRLSARASACVTEERPLRA